MHTIEQIIGTLQRAVHVAEFVVGDYTKFLFRGVTDIDHDTVTCYCDGWFGGRHEYESCHISFPTAYLMMSDEQIRAVETDKSLKKEEAKKIAEQQAREAKLEEEARRDLAEFQRLQAKLGMTPRAH